MMYLVPYRIEGRPLNVRKTSYVMEWFVVHFLLLFSTFMLFCRETERQAEKEELLSAGKVPHEVEVEKKPEMSLKGQRCRHYMDSIRLD